MEYNQKIIDRIRNAMPLNMRKQLFERINKDKQGEDVISYSTITDVLRTYREGGWKRERRLEVYDTAVQMLKEKGYNIKRIKP